MANETLDAARRELDASIVRLRGEPVGTVAARDPDLEALNYDQVFTRDFAVSAVAYLLEGRPEIVRAFLEQVLELQSQDRHMDCFRPGQGLMPVSFKVLVDDDGDETIEADFGEKAIARVAPVDAPLWWLFLLRAYEQATGDTELAARPEAQRGIRLILDLALTTRFDMFPTMLVPDGSFMIDRRMGVYGHPLDVQVLLYAALRAAMVLLDASQENALYRDSVRERLGHLAYHLRSYYWLDFDGLSRLYRSGVEQYGRSVDNAFNIYPESIPSWLLEWMPRDGGYFVGNLGPARMDFRFFAAGNLLAIVTGLAEEEQVQKILNLIAARWSDLVGQMPMKVVFPALEGETWRTLTGGDPKNSPWSYQNAGSWPFLLWLLAAASISADRPEIAREALAIAEERLVVDRWPEYYDGPAGRVVGREARLFQTWSFAGYLVARRLVDEPELFRVLDPGDDDVLIACDVTLDGGGAS